MQRTNVSAWLVRKISAAALFAALPIAAVAQIASAVPPVKLGIVTFLTGPAAGPFGIPGRNSAEIMIEMLNAGKVPAPYATVGLAGAPIVPKFVDENGSTANQVTEFRNLVQRDGMNAVVGYVSSGNCLAVAPVAEELKALTVFWDCGTPGSSRKSRSNTSSVRHRTPPWITSRPRATS